MNKIILQFNEQYVSIIGSSYNCSVTFFYIITFLRNLTQQEAQSGVDFYNFGQINDFAIDYEGEDYYVAFSDLIETPGEQVVIQGFKFVDISNVAKLKLSYENFDYIFKTWAKILLNNPQYLIITQDDFGWVGLQAKDELNDDDLQLIEGYNQRQEAYKSAEKIRVQKRNQEIN